jgi:hypothetical protein
MDYQCAPDIDRNKDLTPNMRQPTKQPLSMHLGAQISKAAALRITPETLGYLCPMKPQSRTSWRSERQGFNPDMPADMESGISS